MSCGLGWRKKGKANKRTIYVYLLPQKCLVIFLCHSATLSHRTDEERNTVENNLYKDIFPCN